jgi:protein TonB
MSDRPDASPAGKDKDNVSEIRLNRLAGVLEVFSPLPNAFSPATQTVLEDFARECAQIRSAASHLHARPPAEIVDTGDEPDPTGPELIPPPSFAIESPVELLTQPYKLWTLVLAAVVLLAAVSFTFLIGSRVGWLRSSQPAASAQPAVPVPAQSSPVVPAKSVPVAPAEKAARKPASQPAAAKPADKPAASSNELVVYQKGKVIFRMPSAVKSEVPSPATSEGAPANNPAPEHPASSPPNAVWLAPDEAESRLLNRVEPQYPADAIASHRSGNVTLEVHVAEDGSVSSVQTLSGDPLLVTAAVQAVRNWRYQPYRAHEQPSPFQTDVTLTFSLPN